MFTEWKQCFIMTEGHIVYLLREKDTQTKLQLLYDQLQYPMAIALGQDWQLEEKEISMVHQVYANYLYEQHEYDKAIKE